MARGYAVRKQLWVRQASRLLLLVLIFCVSASLQSQSPARFDLVGPKVDVVVARDGKTLPIALVPNLQAGDKLTIHADLPPTQSVKLVLIVCFLRGSTNPPPDQWFTRVETWGKRIREEGVTISVPDEAQQAMMFIAPETGGDFSTLRSAIRGRPGIFVRASQDLNEASFEQARIEHYLQLIRRVPAGSPEELLDHSHKLAATLNLKPNDDCFTRTPDLQLACLRQTGNQVLLDDGHGQSLATLVTSGASADLIGSVAGSPMMSNSGSYSAYVGTVIDVVRLLSGLHTAQFQYIPAIAFPEQQTLNLRLNTPPSFHNPKSVIVIALPAIQKAVPPPLRLRDPQHVSCLLMPSPVLPLEGAPLVFATSFAHSLTLHLNNPTAKGQSDLSLTPDAYEGGLVVSAPEKERRALEAPATGSASKTPSSSGPSQTPVSDSVLTSGIVRGFWGFDPFEGPTVSLQRIPGRGWSVEQRGEIIAGKANQLLLHADGTACTESIQLENSANHEPLSWKQGGSDRTADTLAVKLPLEKAAPGGITLDVRQFGDPDIAKVSTTAYSDAPRPESLHVHAGDTAASLAGTGLSDVKSAEISGISYAPAQEQVSAARELRLVTSVADKKKASALKAGEHGLAHIVLADGRILPVPFTVDPPRPVITLLSKTMQQKSDGGSILTLMDKDAIPLTSRLSFAIRSDAPSHFPRSEKVEIATTDGTLRTTLQISDSSLILQDAKTALGFLTPLSAFGQSAFGPLQLRAVAEDGTVGDWQQLGTLVRTPDIQGVTCGRPASRAPAAPDTTGGEAGTDAEAASETSTTIGQLSRRTSETRCTLTGSALFLIESIAADSSFAQPFQVPVGYAEPTLTVPRPTDNHTLFLRLRDDPDSLVSLATSQTTVGRHANTSPLVTPQTASRR